VPEGTCLVLISIIQMKIQPVAKRRLSAIAIFLMGAAIFLALKAGAFLVVDSPQPSDVIVVLAGETDHRPRRALDLLAQHYGQRIILDVPTNATIYEFTQIDLAKKYIQDLPQASLLSVCPIDGLSTKDESKDVEKCLQQQRAKKVLIVTSDFHTRRALDVFRREVPEYEYSVAGAENSEAFGEQWWSHRQWAKTFVDEWLRLLWWKAIDQWRR
jgi:DNA-binding NarL/FixJ family response regulator